MRNMTTKKWLGLIVKLLMGALVLGFLGINSLTFFEMTTPPDKYYYSFLGFGLTSGAVIGYIILLLTDADTSLKKTITIAMLIVSVVGEALTAYFGMKIEAWKAAGFVLTESDFTLMLTAVELLAILHGLAIVAYFVGDKIAEALGDEDGDGILNYKDKDYKNKNQMTLRPVRQFNSEVELPTENPTNPPRKE